MYYCYWPPFISTVIIYQDWINVQQIVMKWNTCFAETNIFISVISGCSRSRWPRGLRLGTPAARLVGLLVRNPPATWMSVSCDCCVLSGRGLCDLPIPLPEEIYRVWQCDAWECDREASIIMWRPWSLGAFARGRGVFGDFHACFVTHYLQYVSCLHLWRKHAKLSGPPAFVVCSWQTSLSHNKTHICLLV
jgi:hypothetical protein